MMVTKKTRGLLDLISYIHNIYLEPGEILCNWCGINCIFSRSLLCFFMMSGRRLYSYICRALKKNTVRFCGCGSWLRIKNDLVMHFNLIFSLFICMWCVGVLALSTGLECIQPANKDKTETLICINSNFTCVYDCDDRAFFALQLRLGLWIVETQWRLR